MLRKLGIEPGEGRLFFWAAGVLFLLGWADVSVKNASETLFLKGVGVEFLPLGFPSCSSSSESRWCRCGSWSRRSSRVVSSWR
ncbi:MAG: hypothetical protein JRG80_04405 [Deltaproteobacteria bacterium]|nr:hypothetical protein [Deltaproteobacteria bacterium]